MNMLPEVQRQKHKLGPLNRTAIKLSLSRNKEQIILEFMKFELLYSNPKTRTLLRINIHINISWALKLEYC